MRSRDVFRLNVKDRMNRQGLRVKDLADMVSLSPSYLSLVLSGDRANLSDQHKDAIALALGTTVAELYTEGPADAGGPGSSASVAPHVDAGFVLRRPRDITPFEDFLRVLNVSDDLLLQAYYRELNSLSDEDVRRLGGMLRNVLVSWQAAVREAGAGGIAARSVETAGPFVEPDHRVLLWLVSYMSRIAGEVPLSAVSAALSWTQERLHRSLEALVSAGAVTVVSSDADKPGGTVLVRTDDKDLANLSRWIPVPLRRSSLVALAREIEGDLAVRPEHIAEVYLEGGDLRSAREWYLNAAVRAVDAGLWRVAKNYLLVVSSLDTVLATPGEERVPTAQMLVTTCQNLGETDEALAYQERNLAFWERSASWADMVRGLLTAASMLARRREWDRATEYLKKALSLSSEDFSAQARVRLGMAAAHAERGFLQRSRDEYERALDLAGKAQEQSLMVHALLGLGRIWLWRQDHQRCAQHLNRALSLSEKRETALETMTRTELGKLRFQEGSYALARDHLEKAVNAASSVGNAEIEAAAKAWLSRSLGRGKGPMELPVKWDLARAARAHFSVSGERHGLIASLLACAEADAAAGDDPQAEATFREAIDEARSSDNPALEALACQAYGEYLENRDTALSQVMLERARWARARFR